MTNFNPDIHHRRSIRLKDYDYSQAGAYFVTMCAWHRECLFGEIENGEMRVNEYAGIAQACWDDLPNHYYHIELDAFVIMPNHVHGIVILTDEISVGAGLKPAPTKRHGLSEIIRAFKTFSSRRINETRDNPGCPIWQRNYHERVIRNDEELNRVREYIMHNPAGWAEDEDNPMNIK